MKRILLWMTPLLFLLAACSSGSPATSVKPTPTPSPLPLVYATVGKPVTLAPWAISLQSVKLIDPATIAQHDQIFPSVTSDQRFLLLNEHIQNISTTSANIAGGQFSLQDTHGNANFPVQVGVPGVTQQSLGGTMGSSMQQVGQEVYTVPVSTHDFYWIYTASDNVHQIIWKFSV